MVHHRCKKVPNMFFPLSSASEISLASNVKQRRIEASPGTVRATRPGEALGALDDSIAINLVVKSLGDDDALTSLHRIAMDGRSSGPTRQSALNEKEQERRKKETEQRVIATTRSSGMENGTQGSRKNSTGTNWWSLSTCLSVEAHKHRQVDESSPCRQRQIDGDEERMIQQTGLKSLTDEMRPRTCAFIVAAMALMWTIILQNSSMIASATIVKPQGFRELEKQIVDRILGEGYDKRIRPTGINNKTGQNDGPAVVRVNTLIRSISKIDDVTMEYSVQLSLRQEWVDERLAFKRLAEYKSYNINSITLTEQERLWKPDLFFRNEKEGHFHKIIMPNVLLRISGDGAVLYSIRISLVLACPMDLKYYPLDKQNCTIEMASYGYLDDDLKFIWKEKNPVQINQPLTLPRFTLETFGTAFCTSRTSTGAYSCLRVDLIFKREFSYYLIQIYIPCCMLVIVSWVSFWLDPNAIPARVSLGVTTLLTMATQISGINASLPPVSYTKAIDVWTGVCLTFVFGALLEFALVNYASRSDAHARMQQARQEEELRVRELEYQQRQQLAAAAAAAAAAAQQQQQQHHANHRSANNNNNHLQQQQQYATYGPNYAQKFPINRSQDLVVGAAQGKAAQVAASNANGGQPGQQQQQQAPASVGQQPNHLPTANGQLHNSSALAAQYTIVNTAVANADTAGELSKPLLPNGLASFASSGKQQCEIHHSVLHHSSNNHHSSSSAGNNNNNHHHNAKKVANVNFCRAWLNKFPSRSKRIDVISRIFFPKMFALFNLVYWTTYLFREDDIVHS